MARRSLCEKILSWLVVCLVYSSVRHATAQSTGPIPISVPPSQAWDDDNGKWSTFNVRVGNPPQDIRLLPATGQTSTIVVNTTLCEPDYDDACLKSRGGKFDRNESTSYDYIGNFAIRAYWEEPLGLNTSAYYGYETVTLGFGGSGLPTLARQTVGTVLSTRAGVYIGFLPLNPRPTNFTDFNDPQESLLHALRNSQETAIPSTSWSYTAGCYNCGTGAFGSLVLGGYDSSIFTPNDVVFPFGADISADTMVNIPAISSNATSETFLESSIAALITSVVPDLWLPASTCSVFQTAFGLSYDEENNIHTVDASNHASLMERNPSVTIDLSPSLASGSSSVQIAMSYTQMWLPKTSPRPEQEDGTVYFPLRVAANNTQYTLGRVFLQSAHLSVDYDRRVFNVSQAKLRDPAVPEAIVAILPPGQDIATSDDNGGDGAGSKDESSSLGTGAIVGAVLGSILAAIACLLGVLFYRRRASRKKIAELEASPRHPFISPMSPYAKSELENSPSASAFKFGIPQTPVELPVEEKLHREMDADESAMRAEHDGRPIHLIGGVHEMDGQDLWIFPSSPKKPS